MGVAKGCLGLLLVAAFFIGVPTLIYYRYFGPAGPEDPGYWEAELEKAADAMEYDQFIPLSDSVLAQGPSITAYYYKLMGAHYTSNQQALDEAVAGLEGMDWQNGTEVGIVDLLTWLPKVPMPNIYHKRILLWYAKQTPPYEVESEYYAMLGVVPASAALTYAEAAYLQKGLTRERLNWLLNGYEGIEAYDSAIDLLKRLLKDEPNDAERLTQLGDFYSLAGKPVRAAECYEKALALSGLEEVPNQGKRGVDNKK